MAVIAPIVVPVLELELMPQRIMPLMTTMTTTLRDGSN
jgi:hypothetical protein